MKVRFRNYLLKIVKQTSFYFELSGLMKKGVFISNDISLQTPVMRVGGRREVDLDKR